MSTPRGLDSRAARADARGPGGGGSWPCLGNVEISGDLSVRASLEVRESQSVLPILRGSPSVRRAGSRRHATVVSVSTTTSLDWTTASAIARALNSPNPQPAIRPLVKVPAPVAWPSPPTDHSPRSAARRRAGHAAPRETESSAGERRVSLVGADGAGRAAQAMPEIYRLAAFSSMGNEAARGYLCSSIRAPCTERS